MDWEVLELGIGIAQERGGKRGERVRGRYHDRGGGSEGDGIAEWGICSRVRLWIRLDVNYFCLKSSWW